MNHNIEDYQLASSIEGGDGFSVKIFVHRPPDVQERVDNLSNASENNELTPKELASTMFLRECSGIRNKLYMQAALLDPKNPERKQKNRDDFREAFNNAGFDIIFMEEIPNEYWGKDSVENLTDPWFIVTTSVGHIKVGWRKRVIVLDWERTPIESSSDDLFPEEDVTHGIASIHAWGYEKLTQYLKVIKEIQ